MPAGSPGLAVSPLTTISSDRQFEVVLDRVNVPAGSALGLVDGGWPVVQRALQRAITGKCLEMLGGPAPCRT